MSADNGIFIGVFPVVNPVIPIPEDEEYRVAHASMSVIDELETHFYSPEDYRNAIIGIFGKSEVYTEKDAALLRAGELSDQTYTEYGIVEFDASVPYGELREEIPIPAPPDGACEFCSGTTHFTIHPKPKTTDTSCKDPSLPFNVLVKAFRKQVPGIDVYRVAHVVIETLDAHNALK